MAGFAEQGRIVLQRKRRIGMVAAEYLLEDGEGPAESVRLRLVQLSLRSIEARQIVADCAGLSAVRAKDLLGKRECLQEPLLGLRKASLELVERGEVLQCLGYVSTGRVERGLEDLQGTKTQLLPLRRSSALCIEGRQICKRDRQVEAVCSRHLLEDLDDLPIEALRLRNVREPSVAQSLHQQSLGEIPALRPVLPTQQLGGLLSEG